LLQRSALKTKSSALKYLKNGKFLKLFSATPMGDRYMILSPFDRKLNSEQFLFQTVSDKNNIYYKAVKMVKILFNLK